MELNPQYLITSPDQLSANYDAPSERVILKQIDHLDEHCRAFIEAAPFLVLGTCGPGGMDCSPRGDPAGFVQLADEKTLLIPDRRGNNRIDSLRNIIADPRVGLLFLVPGVNETFRVNGKARISVDPDLLARFAVKGALPKAVIVVTVEEAFIQCSRALLRADLWNPELFIDRADLPSTGTILAAHIGKVNAAEYDAEQSGKMAKTLY